MIQIHCPYCQSSLAVDDTMAGQTLACPDCAREFRVSSDEQFQPTRPRPPGKPFHSDSGDQPINPEDRDVLVELEKLQNKKAGWGSAILILIVTLVLYMGAAQAQEIWQNVAILIPTLFFHELGHYAAMRVYGYRNLRMFFIPFFGAAVSGQNYNVDGVTKSVVALAGPLPGILVGVPLAVVGALAPNQLLIEIASFLFILNGFNLLPFLPLDGGWVVHAVLFVRHPVLDLVFRIGATLCLLAIAIPTMSWCLIGVGVFMLLAAPLAYKQARIAHRLRYEGLVMRSLDDNTIPAEGALQILAELRRVLPANTSSAVLAQNVANVFEACNAEPPGVLGSLVLLAVHALGFFVALVGWVAVMLLQHPVAAP